MEKLKPCPFCGGEAETVIKNSWFYDTHGKVTFDVFVGCKTCGIFSTDPFKTEIIIQHDGSIDVLKDGKVEAIALWNHRKGERHDTSESL